MNIDQQEVQKFADLAVKWWDKSGDFKPLHVINPLSAEYISSKVELNAKNVLDVGCGGGIFSGTLFGVGGSVLGNYWAGAGIVGGKLPCGRKNKDITYI